ncbi:hypothetical protein HJ526_15780 [Donghicola sp. C2-DW-16]|uniref:Uncharacterized protein n=1 Tax=Donghicola mangrovi TaxID=2729614 RepID=A0A850Q8T6_9RHOB|nr:hypothetical protein [Donghicola mangrovi]NVO24642.1 hypothetical protein [Donghicola mangrovi]NVO28890.1 hypothetical protein [Donghicola mangrovi]
MSDQELTRQEEDVVAPEFDLEEIRDGHSFGNWPEVIGLIFTVFVCWLTFAFRG